MASNNECEFNKEFLLTSTILYIESDDEIRASTYDIFSCIFKEVIVAKDLTQAANLFKENQNKINVILADINLPDKEALELISSLRDIDWDIPLLLSTSFDEPELILKLIKFNITNYIVHPIQISTTFKIIAQLMEKEKLREEIKRKEHELKQFMSIIDSINLVCEIDLEGNIIAANDLFLFTSGYNLEEIVDKKHSNFSKPYDTYESEESIFEYLKEGNVWSGDYRKEKKNGEHYYTFSIILPIYDKYENLVKFVECATSTTKYKSEILNLKKQIIAIKSESFKHVIENKIHESYQTELTQKYLQRVDDSVNKEQLLVLELHGANKKIKDLEKKLGDSDRKFKNFQSFHYEKVQELIKRYKKK